MLKNGASNKPGSSMKQPYGVWLALSLFPAGSQCVSTSNRSAGIFLCTSRPFSRRSQNFSVSVAPPGILHAMPTIAILDCIGPLGAPSSVVFSAIHGTRSSVDTSKCWTSDFKAAIRSWMGGEIRKTSTWHSEAATRLARSTTPWITLSHWICCVRISEMMCSNNSAAFFAGNGLPVLVEKIGIPGENLEFNKCIELVRTTLCAFCWL
jgi:hypothetical protein